MDVNNRKLKISRAIYLILVPINFLRSYIKAFLSSFGGVKKDRYFIKTQYVSRRRNIHLDTSSSTDEYQDEVYAKAKHFFIEKEMNSVLDFGCGSGYKLLKYFDNVDTVGVELSPAFDFLKDTYPNRRWILSDFHNPPEGHFDLVTCIDVIEHLKNPDELMVYLQQIDFDYVFLSTPDRDKLGYLASFGPPQNLHHIREWGKQEFIDYVSKYFEGIRSEVVSHHEHFVVAKKFSQAS
ncbi:MAG: class I SAM-dependent methyltransferase [Anaerolineales bacterium]|nr:class I SAM-dependent methyltransferase [Anaerolineales bacterium]